MNHDFRRVAIVNRGEAAMRFIHAAREFNHEQGASLRTIALFTDPDRNALFVREADEAFYLGPPRIADPITHQAKSIYVDYASLEHALTEAGAEAVWPGWGFVAEHADFADLCRELGIVFIGPDGDAMRKVGDKIQSKLLAERAQISVAAWSGGAVETVSDACLHAERLGFPLLIKATAGGGGHGIRRVHSANQLAEAFESARAEAFKAFGNPTVFMEQLLDRARHVEVQVIADHYGSTWAVGVRDCTIQRRHQKILEESPSPALSHEQHDNVRAAAVRLSQAAGYHNAGTVEFLYQPETQQFAFMEMNTRLQVEHPVTECTTGLDMVKLQIHVARGGRLEGEPAQPRGHAIEVRLNAEDPDNGFAPAPGFVERFRMLSGPGVRIDTGVMEGDVIPSDFDSMIAKIIGFGRTRQEALSRLQRVLRDSVVVIKGGCSNKSFLLRLVGQAEVQKGQFDVGWLDRSFASDRTLSDSCAHIALIQAAIEVHDAELALEQARFYASAVRGRPQVQSDIGRTVSLRHRGHTYSAKVNRIGLKQYSLEFDGTKIDARLEALGKYEYWLTVAGRRFHVVSVPEGLKYRVEVDGVAHEVSRDDGGFVHAPSPAVVVSVSVQPGDLVSAGDRLVVLEAMKMEMEVVAPFSGRVRKVTAIPNVQVDTGAQLLQIEPISGEEAPNSTWGIDFQSAVATRASVVSVSKCRQNLEQLRQLMLGFEVDPTLSPRLLTEWSQHCDLTEDCTDVIQTEDEVLKIFIDVCSLFQREPKTDGALGGEGPSAEANLFAYLRALDTSGEDLPEWFVEALRAALAHYGVKSLERSPELEESLFWLYKAHQRTNQQIATVLGILERRLTRRVPSRDEAYRALLSRMILLTRDMVPAISDLAEQVRYRCFDQPQFERARQSIYAEVDSHLAYLASSRNPTDRHERMRTLIECPQPLVPMMSMRFASADLAFRQLMLELITYRYYRIRKLTNLHCVPMNGYSSVSAEYDDGNKHVHVISTQMESDKLHQAISAVRPFTETVPENDDVVIDLYAWYPDRLPDVDRTRQEVQALLNEASYPPSVQRVVVAIAAPGGDRGLAAMQHFTYLREDGAFREYELFRGVHPMMAERLHFWRLQNFKIERLPSAEDVYLLRAVATDNPKDERLFACAEVRDLTPVRDESGRIIQLPHLERMFAEAAAGIRQFQSRRSLQQRLYWNRVFLYVWPPLDLKPREWRETIKRLAPAAEGLGLEQVVVRARIPNPETGELRDMVVRISSPTGSGMLMTFRPANKLQPIKQLSEYEQKVVRMRQRGLIYPYEIVKMLTPFPDDTRAEFPHGDFVEYDLSADGELVPVERPYGQNKSNIIAGVIRNFTSKYPEGMARVALLGDPSKDLGALAEPECRRIIAAIDLAEKKHAPLEWFAISAGAKISMSSGVENMDWIAKVLRRIVEFTQGGGEINLIIDGINVGAQPYWNAEATMLMHTRGILVMTPRAAMVLTGKRALDYSGGVSAEDNQGIGGYDRIMGPNGQAQYWARDINQACHILLRHYEHTYIANGERFPRPAATSDPFDRDVQQYAQHASAEESFTRVGEIFSEQTNPGRKKSFDIRKVMRAVIDQDHSPLERWPGMRAAEIGVIWDAHLGGYPVCLIGIESKPVSRMGFVPADGPDQWSAGTLFPQSSKKVARAINAASNNRPVVILANLSGFDGSPESMRKLQLEYGAEIGRAVVNFKGPIVFCVISRYHGGAYVVFSRMLNEGLEVAALEGTFASVIGGAPAAAVVFAGEVESRARKDVRLQALSAAIASASEDEKVKLRAEWNETLKVVHSEKLGEVASEFDRVHSVHRALDVGALNQIIPPSTLRAYLIDAVARGIARELAKTEALPVAV
jgi:acetyl/propionyl-CoA carboxylase alpha subunit/acetyl-CoA carboxylase carboxyltransferase component